MSDTTSAPAATASSPGLRPYSRREAQLTPRTCKVGGKVAWAEPGRILGWGTVVGHTAKNNMVRVQPEGGGPVLYFGYFQGTLMSRSGVPKGNVHLQPADMAPPPVPEPRGTAAVCDGISKALKRAGL